METPIETEEELTKAMAEHSNPEIEWWEPYWKRYKVADAKVASTWPVEVKQEKPNESLFPVADADFVFLN